jgi:hypothetical protein
MNEENEYDLNDQEVPDHEYIPLISAEDEEEMDIVPLFQDLEVEIKPLTLVQRYYKLLNADFK